MTSPLPPRRRLALAALPALAALLSGCIEFAEAGSNAAGNFFLDLILFLILLLIVLAIVVAALLGVGLYGLFGKGRAAQVAAGVATVSGAALVLLSFPSFLGLGLGALLLYLGLSGLRKAKAARVPPPAASVRPGPAAPPQAPRFASAVVIRRPGQGRPPRG